MAVRGGAADALPPDLDTAEQLLIVNDFPHGFDDRAVTQLRYLADEGPAVGVHLLMVADREDASAYGPVLDPLWRSLLRITPVPDDHLADPWVGHAWTYEPLTVPPGSGVLRQVLDQVAAARRRLAPLTCALEARFTEPFTFPWVFPVLFFARRGVLPDCGVPVSTDRHRSRGAGPAAAAAARVEETSGSDDADQ